MHSFWSVYISIFGMSCFFFHVIMKVKINHVVCFWLYFHFDIYIITYIYIQGWDDNINSSVHNSTPHIFPLLHTNCSSNSAILCNNYISLLSDLCACVHAKKKNGVAKEAIVLQRAVQTASWDFKSVKSDGLVHCSVENAAVLCENHRERVHHLKKKNILAVWRLSGLVLSRCLSTPLGMLFVKKTLEDER